MLIKKNKERFVFSELTSNKKALDPKFLNRNIIGKDNQIFIRESFGNKDRYEVHVSEIGDKYKYLYTCPKAIATTVVKIAERFNIELK